MSASWRLAAAGRAGPPPSLTRCPPHIPQRHRPPQKGHRPPRLHEQRIGRRVHVPHQKPTRPEPPNDIVDLRRRAARFVGIGEAVDGRARGPRRSAACRQPRSPRWTGRGHQGDGGALGGRALGVGREQAVDFVEDEQGLEATRAGQGARIGEQLFEQHAEHERALFVVEVATLTITAGVRPFLGVSHPRTSNEVPSRQLAKVGEASSVLRAAARFLRSSSGRKALTASAPMRSIGGWSTMAYAAATGVLHGNTITLDAPVPPLDGQRVRITIALDDQDLALAVDDQARLWDEWARRGPQGPIEDDEEPEFP